MKPCDLLKQLIENKSKGLVSIPMHLYSDVNNKVGKQPRGKGWNTVTMDTCEEFFMNIMSTKYKPVNGLGILTGEKTDLLVIDYDSYKEDSTFDDETFYSLFYEKTYAVKSISGGIHYYFKYTPLIKQTQGNGKIIDIRSNGGCIGTFPSKFGDKGYELINDIPIATLSDEQITFINNYLIPKRIVVTSFKEPDSFESVVRLCLDCFTDEFRDDYSSWKKVVKAVKIHLKDAGLPLIMDWTKTSSLFKSENWVVDMYNDLETFVHLDIDWLKKKAKWYNPNKYYATIANTEFSIDRMLDLSEASDDPVLTSIKYFNKYHYKIRDNSIMYASVNDNRLYIYTKDNLKDLFANANVPYIDADDKNKTANVVLSWLKYKDMNLVYGTTFEPNFYEPRLITKDKKINIFRGGIHKYNPNHIVDMDLVQPWLNHLDAVWCNKNKVLLDFTIGRFAIMLQRPTYRCPVNIVVSGDQGSGKTCFLDYMGCNVIGSKYYNYYADMGAFNEGFNSEQEQAILICLDEINSGGMAYKQSDKLKSMTTRKCKTINNKYGGKYTVPDHSSMVFLTNNTSILRIEQGDRRYFMLECSNHLTCDVTYFKNLMQFDTIASGYEFFHYLMNFDLESFNPNKIPSTDWKIQSMLTNIKPITFCILSWLHINQDEDSVGVNKTIFSSDMWDTCTSKYGAKLPNLTQTKFYHELANFFGCKTLKKIVDGESRRYYLATTDFVYDKLCMMLKVDSLDCILNEFEELSVRAGDSYMKQCMIP